jgi:hypothetical protein
MHTELKEDSPVTTTDNSGNSLILPQEPMAPKNIFRRVKEISDQKKKTKTKTDNS